MSNVENVNILGRVDGLCEAFQPATGLTPEEVGTIQRYLDAVRSNLLCQERRARRRRAEEILIPILVKSALGVSLDELGVSLINIRSTEFRNVAVLFHNTRIRKRCGIITDLDAAFIDTTRMPRTRPQPKGRRQGRGALRQQGWPGRSTWMSWH